MLQRISRFSVVALLALAVVAAFPAAVLACLPFDNGMIGTVPVSVMDELPGGG